MSEDEREKSDEDKENKKKAKKEPKEETKFGSAKVKPGKIMKVSVTKNEVIQSKSITESAEKTHIC